MQYLTVKQILLIHSMIIDETGGSHGVRDTHAILSAAESPKQAFSGRELYATVFEKAAAYARDIIMNHPFVDGNKRTGMTAASVFLEDNGYTVSVKEGEIERFALRIVKERLDVKEIAEWFKTNSKKLGDQTD